MTITVALQRRGLGPVAVPIEVGSPNQWSEAEARDFLYTLQRLLGGGGIHAQYLRRERDGLGIEVVGVGGRVTTPPLPVSETAHVWLDRVMFELPPP